ncbi:MAG: MGMT family protein [Deltaproteobacteria bacterium]|nr:MGMT family protein [Deltaproteobacteria bacterium]
MPIKRHETITFRTAWGACSIAWAVDGIVRVLLPGASKTTSSDRGDPPGFVKDAMRRIIAHLKGTPQDYLDLPVDLGGMGAFSRDALEAARTIPWGATTTYGELAALIGRPGAARAVGQAMARNPVPLVVPCHRVLASGGRLRGFSAPGGIAVKQRLLGMEGVRSVRE